MSVLLPLSFSLVLLVPTLVHAATLGNPGHGSFYSGIGVISGWKCEAEGDLTIVFNNDGQHIPLLYGAERTDVRANGQCLENAHDNVGFVSIMNWAELGDGTHTAVVYDNGVEFARSTFTVATTGEPFVRGAEGECHVPDFPAPGETMRFVWNQHTQHLEMVSDRRGGRGRNGDDDEEGGGICDRTPQVVSAILQEFSRTDCEGVTTADLASIGELSIQGFSLSLLKVGDFAGLTNLKFLYLYNNQLTTLPSGLFAGLANLEVITLSNNQLTTLPPGLFAGLVNLEGLWLHRNQLTTLPPGLFAGLANLGEIWLQTNQLTTLPPGLFAGLGNLWRLCLYDNPGHPFPGVPEIGEPGLCQ